MNKYEELIRCAISAREKSYSPYSNFKVGASLLCKSGEIYTGCNIENSAYSDTVCAERVAILKAVSDGKREFSAMAIVGGMNSIGDYTYPCGTCRQVMAEFCAKDFEIVLYNGKESAVYTLENLLPKSFGKEIIK